LPVIRDLATIGCDGTPGPVHQTPPQSYFFAMLDRFHRHSNAPCPASGWRSTPVHGDE